MKRLISRLVLGLLSLIIVAVAAVSLICLFFLKPIVTSQIKSRTGYDIKVEKLTLNPFTASAEIDGFVLTNPAQEFKTPGFIELRSLHGEVSLFSLFSERIVVNSAKLDLPSVTLVRRAKGSSNAELFAERLMGDTSTATSTPAPAPKPGEPDKPVQFLIKRLDVNVGKVVVASETADGSATSRDYTINYKYTYTDVSDPKQFITKELEQSLLGVVSQLTELIPGKFGESVNSVLKVADKAIKEPVATVNDIAQGLLDMFGSKKSDEPKK